MRNVIVVICTCIFLFPSAFGQSSNNGNPFNTKYYLSKGDVIYINNTSKQVEKKMPIQLLKKVGDTLYFSLIHSTIDSAIQEPKIDKGYMLNNDGTHNAVVFQDWDSNILTIPIKIRPKIDGAPIQFLGETAIGTYIGFQKGVVNYAAQKPSSVSNTFFAFGAPTMVRLNINSTENKSDDVLLGLSFGAGYLLNLNSYQIGIVGGLDYISGNASTTWIYQGRPWVSFSIGYDFNDEEK